MEYPTFSVINPMMLVTKTLERARLDRVEMEQARTLAVAGQVGAAVSPPLTKTQVCNLQVDQLIVAIGPAFRTVSLALEATSIHIQIAQVVLEMVYGARKIKPVEKANKIPDKVSWLVEAIKMKAKIPRVVSTSMPLNSTENNQALATPALQSVQAVHLTQVDLMALVYLITQTVDHTARAVDPTAQVVDSMARAHLSIRTDRIHIPTRGVPRENV